MSGRITWNGRTQRVLAYLDSHPDGATIRELIEQTEPGCPTKNMAATTTMLSRSGDIERTGVWGRSVYKRVLKPGATPTATPVPATKPKAVAAPPQAKPTTTPTPRPNAPPQPTKRRPSSVSPLHAHVQDRAHDRDAIAEQIARFEANGGVIERLPNGASSQGLLRGHRDLNAMTWRERELAEA